MPLQVRVRTFNLAEYSMAVATEIEEQLNEQFADGHGIANVWTVGSLLIIVFAPMEQKPTPGGPQIIGIPEGLIRFKKGN